MPLKTEDRTEFLFSVQGVVLNSISGLAGSPSAALQQSLSEEGFGV